MRVIVACAGVLSAAAVAHAGAGRGLGNDDLFWITFGSGSWFDPMHWSEPRVPTAFDTVIFKNDAVYTVTCGVPATVEQLSIRQGVITFLMSGGSIGSISPEGALSTVIGEIPMDNAHATFRDGRFQPAGITVGLAAGAKGTGVFSGSLARFLPGGPVVVGGQGEGVLAFEAGSRAQILDQAIVTTLGAADGAVGAISLVNTNTRWTSAGKLFVGVRGAGSVVIGDNASLITGETHVALHTGSTGSISVLDGAATINGELFLGVGDGAGDFGDALLTVGGSGMLVAHTVRVGSASGVTGDGVVRADVISSGALRPGGPAGDAPGVLTVDGDVALLAGSGLHVEIGAGPNDRRMASDLLSVTGHAHLGGVLFVDLLFETAPALGDRFDILTASSRSGRFDDVALPALDGGLSWRLGYGETGAQLRVVPAPGAMAVLAALGAPIRRRR